MKQIFESDNIRFVEVSRQLAGDYLVMVNDYEHVGRIMGGKRRTYTEEQEIEWVEKKLKERATAFSMIEKKSGRFIGNIELMEGSGSVRELGIAITAEMQERGYGTEAVRALTGYGTDTLGLEKIVLRTDPGNARAIHVYEKCGFREYDRDADHVYMELVR